MTGLMVTSLTVTGESAHAALTWQMWGDTGET